MGSSGARKKKYHTLEDEEFEVLDVRGTAKSSMSWVQSFMNDLTKEPVTKQVAVGGLSGWVVGYLSMKVGKVAATVVGGSMLIMQLAAHKGYIKVDWNRVNKDFEKQAKKLKKEVEGQISPQAGNEDILHDAARALDKKLDKVTSKLDGKLTKADNWLSSQLNKANRSYRQRILGDDVTVDDLYVLNMYILAFSAGTMLGVGTAKII
ncbi:unnamed protein product [Meganyctiphanes norvegica]|uniref:FUN14 domain-containing protein 1 n=1 Tax=Meganyctiphanes norvegica TaxID=48144 RepID=A0AAV2S9T6_MEGNR